jgi:hypothetical protein
MWTRFLKDLTSEYEFSPPANPEQLTHAETTLRHALPQHLKEFYLETNGLYYRDSFLDVVWTLEKVLEENLEFRQNPDFKSLYMSFDNLLFFSELGNGSLFGFAILGDGSARHIYTWNPEDDSRQWIAESLTAFFEWLEAGKIEAF